MTASAWPPPAVKLPALAAGAARPYSYYHDLAEERLQRYFERGLERASRSPGARLWRLYQSGETVGLALLEPLTWDTQVLSRQAARLGALLAAGDYHAALRRKQQLLDGVLDEARRRGVVHLAARVPAEDLAGLHALESRGFETLDAIVTSGQRVEKGPAGLPEGVRLARPADLAVLRRLAAASFRYDRYHADSTIPAAVADHLHAEWIENSVRGLADAVLVAEAPGEPGTPAGFLTLKVDPEAEILGTSIATIVLVATARECRGQGLGRRLTEAAVVWCRAHAIERVEVGTQLRNIPAGRLYAAAGFGLLAASLSLRWAAGGRCP